MRFLNHVKSCFLNYEQIWLVLPQSPEALVCSTTSTSSIPGAGAGGAAAGGGRIFLLGNTEASQVQEVSDHLSFDGSIQRCVGMEARPETQKLQDVL